MNLDKLVELLLAALSTTQVKVILFGIIADVLANVGVSLYTGTFMLPYVANFVKSKLLPYVFGYAAAQMLSLIDPQTYGVLPTAIFAMITLSLLGDVLDALKQLGLPIPLVLTKGALVKGTPMVRGEV